MTARTAAGTRTALFQSSSGMATRATPMYRWYSSHSTSRRPLVQPDPGIASGAWVHTTTPCSAPAANHTPPITDRDLGT